MIMCAKERGTSSSSSSSLSLCVPSPSSSAPSSTSSLFSSSSPCLCSTCWKAAVDLEEAAAPPGMEELCCFHPRAPPGNASFPCACACVCACACAWNEAIHTLFFCTPLFTDMLRSRFQHTGNISSLHEVAVRLLLSVLQLADDGRQNITSTSTSTITSTYLHTYLMQQLTHIWASDNLHFINVWPSMCVCVCVCYCLSLFFLSILFYFRSSSFCAVCCCSTDS